MPITRSGPTTCGLSRRPAFARSSLRRPRPYKAAISKTLGQLLAEIEQQTWVEPPPKALVQGLRKADAQFRGQQTRAILTDLDSRLNDAFAARDPIRGRLARQEWIALTATAPLEPD